MDVKLDMPIQNEILSDLKSLAKSLAKEAGLQSFLYGSRARGDYKDDSDWDILLLGDKDDPEYYENYCLPFAEIGWKYGEQITPLFLTKEEWEKEQNSLFFLNVLQDSIPL